MGKFSGWLICSDFDGTLCWNWQIPKNNVEAIRYFQSEGGLFTYASGRSAINLYELAPEVIPNAPLVTLNGSAVVSYDGRRDEAPETIKFTGISKPEALRIATELFRGGEGMLQKVLFFTPDGVQIEVWRNGDEPTPDVAERLPENLAKMVFFAEEGRGDDLLSAADRASGEKYNTSRSWETGIEVVAKGADKGTATRFLKELVGCERLVCVGDYENDLTMLKGADISYAVENASPSAKAAAVRHTVAAADGAIAAVISDIENNLL